MISRKLRDGGGTWTTIASDAAAQAALSWFVDGEAGLLDGMAIDSPDGTYDAVVVIDVLERVRDDHAFIKECHRVLKTDGRLVVAAARKQVLFPLGSPLRFMLGLSWRRKGLERPGYSPHGFFDVLKDGFDVPETISFATCCIEAPGLVCEALANRLVGGPYNMPTEKTDTEAFYHYTTLYTVASLLWPLMWLASKAESVLIGFLPGHNMAAKTKRRVWRERRTPILIDGRSIAEAALNTKIGTAAPF